MRARLLSGIAVALSLTLALGVGSAVAERAQDGNLIVSLNGGISPKKLPRERRAPVAVFLSGGVETADRTPAPQVNSIKLELAWRGELETRGLPVCPRGRLTSTYGSQALAACGSALVGKGGLYAKIVLPGQTPFGIHADLLAFNGKTKEGSPAIWVQGYSPNPPVSFVLPFKVSHQKGAFKTVLTSIIRRAVGPWPRVASFHIAVRRHYNYNGSRRSYLSASCPIPQTLTAGFLSLARATYSFAGGDSISRETVRSCRAR